MNRKFLTVLLLALLPCLSFAEGPQKYLCTLSDLERRVEILYETGMTLPCEVHYFKDTEAPGEDQVLWRAMNEASYCETKAAAFITKLGDMGWSCRENLELVPAEAEAAVEPEPAVEPAPVAEPVPAEDAEPAAEPESDD